MTHIQNSKKTATNNYCYIIASCDLENGVKVIKPDMSM